MYDEYEVCWFDGQYSTQDCELCPYKHECSGYEGDDAEDED